MNGERDERKRSKMEFCIMALVYAGRQKSKKDIKHKFKTNNITCLHASQSIHTYAEREREREIGKERVRHNSM